MAYWKFGSWDNECWSLASADYSGRRSGVGGDAEILQRSFRVRGPLDLRFSRAWDSLELGGEGLGCLERASVAVARDPWGVRIRGYGSLGWGTEGRVSKGSLNSRGAGLFSGGGHGPGSCGLVPDPDPRQAEQWHGRGPESADGAHPLDASLRQRERPALRQLHMPRSQPAGNVQRLHAAPACVPPQRKGRGRGRGGSHLNGRGQGGGDAEPFCISIRTIKKINNRIGDGSSRQAHQRRLPRGSNV